MINLTMKEALSLQTQKEKEGSFFNIYKEKYNKSFNNYYLIPCDGRSYSRKGLSLVKSPVKKPWFQRMLEGEK